MKQKSSMKKHLRHFLHPLHVHVDKFINLQLVTLEKLKTGKRKTLIGAIFQTAKSMWDILP